MRRRGFIKRLMTGISLAALWKFPNIPSTFASVTKGNLSTYPRPSYVPKNFVEVKALSGTRRCTEGFGDEETEVAWWYRNDSHPLGFNHPLTIFITPNPQHAFGGTQNHQSNIVPITLRSGETVSAEYYDGMWWLLPNGEIGWNRKNVHSLVFYHSNFAIGIRAARNVGIKYDELIAIASSF